MNQTLQTDIYNQIKSAVSASTSHVYFLYLPSDELLTEFAITYELENRENENTFDSLDSTGFYTLQVKLNASNTNSFGTNSIYIKNKVYALKGINSNVGYVSLTNDTTFWDDELEIFTNVLEFEIQYH